MKKFLLFLFVLSCATAFSQTVNIPDPVFKSLLIGQGVDANSNGEIEVSEASVVSSLYISSSPGTMDTVFSVEGIRSFVNLNDAYLSNLSITELDLSGLSQLTSLQISNCTRISSFNFSDCDSLKSLFLDRTLDVAVLDLNTIPSLEHFRYNSSSNNSFQSISTLMASNHPKLANLEMDMVNLNNVRFDHCDSLRTVFFHGVQADSVSITNCTNLGGVWIDGVVNIVDMRNCSGMESFRSSNASFRVLNMTNCTALTSVELMGLITRSIDLSSAANLQSLIIHYGNQTTPPGSFYLNVKNGTQLANFDIDGYGAPADTLFVCADDFEVDSLRAGISHFPNLIVNSTCLFLPQGMINSVQGIVRLAQFGSGCNSSSPGFANVAIKVSGSAGDSLTRFTGVGGRFNHYDYEGTYLFTPQPPSPYFIFVPPSHSITFDTANGLQQSVEFCIQPVIQVNDVEVLIAAQSEANPGFQMSQSVHYQNNGTQVSSGTITYQYDAALLSFVSSSVQPTSHVPGTITWVYSNLMPLQSAEISVSFELLAPPVNNIGDTLTFAVEISGSGTDETPLDNNFILQQEITGSYDPNDKTCLNGPILLPTQLNESLYYLVRFQNLGNDTAINVRVVDSLPASLDLSSLQLLSSSHIYTASLKNNVLEYKFDSILLPPAIHNVQGSNGYVLFKIKPAQYLTVGNSIVNKADIFFDFNPAVITNDAVTTIVSPSQSGVTIIEFSGSRVGENNQLSYKVIFSEPAVKLILESSTDGMNYQEESAGWLLKARSGTVLNFVDEFAGMVKMHYRVRVMSQSGLLLKAAGVVVDAPLPGISINRIVGSGDDLRVRVNVDKSGIYETGIYSIDGKNVCRSRVTLEKGTNSVLVPFGKNSGGVYSFVVFKGRKKYSRAFVWKRD